MDISRFYTLQTIHSNSICNNNKILMTGFSFFSNGFPVVKLVVETVESRFADLNRCRNGTTAECKIIETFSTIFNDFF